MALCRRWLGFDISPLGVSHGFCLPGLSHLAVICLTLIIIRVPKLLFTNGLLNRNDCFDS